MNTVGDLLREADPVAREHGLSPEDVNRMRRAIVAAAETESTIAVWWPRPLIVAATVVSTLVTGVVVGGRWLAPRQAATPADDRQSPLLTTASHERRQLQFATPGGTRIIWVFDPDFNP